FTFLAILALPIVLLGQLAQDQYLEGKRLFNNRQYLSAKATFGNLARSNTPFAPFSAFYYGLSAYKAGDTKEAVDMWKQVLQQYPDWSQKNELLFWLAYAQFADNNFDEGLKYAAMHTESTYNVASEKELIDSFLGDTSLDTLTQLLNKYPDNKLLAEVYVRNSLNVPYSERDFNLIDSLRSNFDLDIKTISDISLPIEKKDQYNIAVLFPFMFESLDQPGRILQNSLVTDMYQGMLLAAEDLKTTGALINLIPYDTKRNKQSTETILKSKGFENTDLIVGPLYSEPVKLIQDYTLKNRVNMINPISTTGEIIGRNPFSFLFQPTTETMALALADLAIQEKQTNEKVMIFYEENDKDSLLAAVYKNKLEDSGYQIVWMRPINVDNAKFIQDSLTAEHDVYLTKEEADSISSIPDREVKTRRVREDELKRIEKERGEEDAFTLPISLDDNNKRIVYYEEVLDMAKDSIGHFMVASRKSVYANNLISVVQARRDSTRIYTYGDWLDFTMTDYNQFERLGITMVEPGYIDKSRYSFKEVSDRLALRFKTLPSEYHYLGYELIWFVGQQMNAYGKYFQVGLREGRFSRGKIYEGMKYGLANDNQVVPILRFKDTELEVVNNNAYGY
ncbi:unnamed protein product, partial [Chrysoparadoxa australica]